MLDMKKAYSTLGLDENATEEDVENRYALLLRKKRNRTDEEDRAAGEPTMSEITEAYNFIKGAAIEEEIKQKEPKSKTAARIGYIYEYYRWHIIGSILALVLIIYTASSVIDSRNEEKRIARADLKVTLFMDYQIQNPQPFEVKMLEGIKEWKDIHLVEQFAPMDPKDEYGMAMLQKAMISMAADKADLYIMDQGNFEKYGKQGAFLNLENQPALSATAKEKRRTLDIEKEGTQWVGIEVSNSPALKSLNLPAGDRIAVIRINAAKPDNALKAIQWLSQP
ncbi:hypothetical protein [Gorillibacterium sp. sgz5001074]|uniref:hypothetical protein n=1 Tax=Gorillibacterium sp. sgz5001074 TaxID=3446695 RepID=UPI003F67FE66